MKRHLLKRTAKLVRIVRYIIVPRDQPNRFQGAFELQTIAT